MEDPIVIVTEHSREMLLTVPEFADRLRVHPKSIYRLIQKGRQAGVVYVGRHLRINASVALALPPDVIKTTIE